MLLFCFFFSSRRRHTRWTGDWSSDVCSSDLRFRGRGTAGAPRARGRRAPLGGRRRPARAAARGGVAGSQTRGGAVAGGAPVRPARDRHRADPARRPGQLGVPPERARTRHQRHRGNQPGLFPRVAGVAADRARGRVRSVRARSRRGLSFRMKSASASPAPRRHSVGVNVGRVRVGGGAPVVVQSMTNTDTADAVATAKQVAELARAGSELVRITVNTAEAAAAVPRIRERLDMMGVDVPLVGDFHYNGHQLLQDEPAAAVALAKYRINPGNVGFGKKRETQFASIVELALQHDKPVRIGANWGSLDQSLLATLMDENHERAEPWDAAHVAREALIRSALD